MVVVSRRFHTSVVLSVSAAVSLCGLFAHARPSYQQNIPNGGVVTLASGEQCGGLGHLSCAGGGPRGSFGLDFAAAGFAWTRELCLTDSDGDGLTNGQELGDPCCTWAPGAGTAGLRTAALSHPGRTEEVNSAPAVECPNLASASPSPSQSPCTKETTGPSVSMTAPSATASTSKSMPPMPPSPAMPSSSSSPSMPAAAATPSSSPSSPTSSTAASPSASSMPTASLMSSPPPPSPVSPQPTESPSSPPSPSRTPSMSRPADQSRCGAAFTASRHLACRKVLDRRVFRRMLGGVRVRAWVQSARIRMRVQTLRWRSRLSSAALVASSQQFVDVEPYIVNFDDDSRRPRAYGKMHDRPIYDMRIPSRRTSCCGRGAAYVQGYFRICPGTFGRCRARYFSFPLNIACRPLCPRGVDASTFTGSPMSAARRCPACKRNA